MLLREEVLPLGSVVRIKDEPQCKFLITGYYAIEKESLYDYCAVLYPTGNRSAEEVLLFNKTDISEIIFHGYKNAGFEMLLDGLEAGYNRLQEQKQSKTVLE